MQNQKIQKEEVQEQETKRPEKTRYHLVFSGSVQAVGFRYRAVHAAGSLGLTGWVKNCWDGGDGGAGAAGGDPPDDRYDRRFPLHKH